MRRNIYKGANRSGSDLRHWGILNMKWGERRYQNEDGTLTEAGKERYRYDDYGGDPCRRGASAVHSAMSSIGNDKPKPYDPYDAEALLKANQRLLNQTLEDLMKGL